MQKSVSTRLTRLLTVFMTAVLVVSCSKISGIKVTTCDVKSVSMRGFKTVDADLLVGIHNPMFAFKINDISGFIIRDGHKIATFEGGNVSVPKNSDLEHKMKCSVSIVDGYTIFQIMTMLKTLETDIDKYNLEATGEIEFSNGTKKSIKFKDIPLEKLIKTLDNGSLKI